MPFIRRGLVPLLPLLAPKSPRRSFAAPFYGYSIGKNWTHAVWTGIGAAGVAVAGMLLFNEPRDMARVFCIFLIIAGAASLRVLAGK